MPDTIFDCRRPKLEGKPSVEFNGIQLKEMIERSTGSANVSHKTARYIAGAWLLRETINS